MAFALSYCPRDGNPMLVRRRLDVKWVLPMCMRRAKELGWDEREPLTLYDLDDVAIGGFVPTEKA